MSGKKTQQWNHPITIQNAKTGALSHFPSISACSRAIKVNVNLLYQIYHGKIKGSRGYCLPGSDYVWRKQGEYFKKKFKIKNWRTGQIRTFSSQTNCAKRLGLTCQIVSDLKCKRRERYGDFCLPEVNFVPKVFRVKNLKTGKIKTYTSVKTAARAMGCNPYNVSEITRNVTRWKHFSHVDYIPKTFSFKNLKTGKVRHFSSLKHARKELGLSAPSVRKIAKNPNARLRVSVFVNSGYTGIVPMVVNRKTGEKIPFLGVSKDDPQSKYFAYLVRNKRINADKNFFVEGCRDYKYLIKDTTTGEQTKVMSLKDFARSRRIRPDLLYRRGGNSPAVEFVEG